MFERPSDQNHYQVLEVTERASSEEIQGAYERAKEIYGSDSVVSNSILAPEERRQILERVTEAYHTLIAEESRRLYDRSLNERDRPAHPENGGNGSAPETARPDYLSGTSPESAPMESSAIQTYPRLVAVRPRDETEKGTAAENDTPAQRAKIALGADEEATGAFLRKAREASGVDLRSISSETKIGVTMLGYIEEERLDRLPVQVYLRNFVSQYARCLGLNDERIALSYVARIRRLQSQGTDAS